MAAADIQSGHAGIANLTARTRRNVFCLEEKAFTRLARDVCEECEECSRRKSGPDHRIRYGPIPAERGKSIRVDMTLGCADPPKSIGFPKAPSVLSVSGANGKQYVSAAFEALL